MDVAVSHIIERGRRSCSGLDLVARRCPGVLGVAVVFGVVVIVFMCPMVVILIVFVIFFLVSIIVFILAVIVIALSLFIVFRMPVRLAFMALFFF